MNHRSDPKLLYEVNFCNFDIAYGRYLIEKVPAFSTELDKTMILQYFQLT